MIITAAAILHQGRIWTGRRHHEILRAIADSTQDWPILSEQGFVAEDGRFVGREEAAQLAFEAGQIPEPKKMLFSEDILL